MEKLHHQRGFTLIELLIVIAIIAILAAILFPVFAAAREKARQSSCASNLKQMGFAVIQYTQDYDENTPIAGWGGPGTPTYWPWAIYPYIKSFNVYKCPDDTSALAMSYGINNNAQGQVNTWFNPAVTIEMMDETGTGALTNNNPDHGLNNDFTVYCFSGRILGQTYYKVPHLDHNGINLLFGDGHIKISTPINMSVSTANALTGIMPFADPAQMPPAGMTVSGTMCTTAGNEGVGNTNFCHAGLTSYFFPTSGSAVSPSLPTTYLGWN